MAKRRGWTHRKGSSKRQRKVTETKNATPKPKIAKKAADVVKPMKTSVDQAQPPPFMVSIPTDVIYALHGSSMRHFNVVDDNNIKVDVDDPTNHASVADDALTEPLNGFDGQEALQNSDTAIMIEAPVSPAETFVEQTQPTTEPTEETKLFSTPVELDISTMNSTENNQLTMLGMLSIPTDVLFHMNVRSVRHSQEFDAIPKQESVEHTPETCPSSTVSHVVTQNNEMIESSPLASIAEESISNDRSNSPFNPSPLSVLSTQGRSENTSATLLNVEKDEPSELGPASWSALAFQLRYSYASRRSSNKIRPDLSPTSTVTKEEFGSPTATADFAFEIDSSMHVCRNGPSTPIKEQCESGEEEFPGRLDRVGAHLWSDFKHTTRPALSPTSTVVKEEYGSATAATDSEDEFLDHSSANHGSHFYRNTRSHLSPTNTIVKEECANEKGFWDHSAIEACGSQADSLDSSDESMRSLENSPVKRSNGKKRSDFHYVRETKPLSNSRETSTTYEPPALSSTPTCCDDHSFASAVRSGRKRPRRSESNKNAKKLKVQQFKRNGNGSETFSWPSLIAPIKYTDPATDTIRKKRFAVSPSRVSEQVESTEESDYDYGWEDPAPPKAKTEVQSKSMVEDLHPSAQEKIKTFTSTLHSEYDLDVIAASRKQLFEAIDTSIAIESNKKLSELDAKIQKTQDDYIRQLFGTDNFASWDDDPALSNVEVTAKLKSAAFKSAVRVDVPLLDKMYMVDVVAATKLIPTDDAKKFLGCIKQFELECAGQELPDNLLQAIKEEKQRISDLVIKSLMPYYNSGRLQPKNLFSQFAREISHIFYEGTADGDSIKSYIDNVFLKDGVVNVTEYVA